MLLRHDGLARLCRARDLLRDFDTPKSVTEVAAAVGMSPFHFIRSFEAMFGATPHQFRIAARLDRARRLLAERRQSVTDVCFDVGCSSLGSFSTLFTDRVGVSPSEYQRRTRPADLTPGCVTLMTQLPAGAFAARAADDAARATVSGERA